jgi:hypothetical protein
VWLGLVAGRYLDVTGPGLYGREFNLYWDAAHLGNVAAMLAAVVPAWAIVLGVVVTVVAVAGAFLATRAAWTRVATAVTQPAWRRVLVGVAGALVVTFAAQDGPWTPGVPFASPVSLAYVRQARFVGALSNPFRASPPLKGSPPMDGPFAALDRADVVLAFVEAYGVVTCDNPVFARALAGPREALTAAVHEAGRTVVSARVESPTFGASSWLAHLSLLTGIEVRDQYTYVSVMASSRDSLPRAFRRQGYRSIAVMPGMRQPWPEGAFYGFDEIYGHHQLEYAGPRFGWWSIPDQYALARLDALELRDTERPPRFVVFPTGTTHAPFGPVPPYQPDWPKVLGPAAFSADEVEHAFANPPDLANLSPSYARAVGYALTTFAGYVREHAGDRMVLILIGDHQPIAAVTGPGASRDVPIHVIASPGATVDRLRAAGFVDGLTPPGPTLTRMHALVPILMDALR